MQEAAGNSGPFDDEETRAFYESLPDVQALVPSVLLNKGQDTKQEGSAVPSPSEPSSPKADGPASSESASSLPSPGTWTRWRRSLFALRT